MLSVSEYIHNEYVPAFILSKEYVDVLSGKTVKYFLGISSDKNVIPQEIEIGNYAWLEFNEALEKITFAEGKKMLIEVGTHLDRIKEL